MFRDFNDIIAQAKEKGNEDASLVVVAAQDEELLHGIKKAQQDLNMKVILVGPKEEIVSLNENVQINDPIIIDAEVPEQMVEKACEYVKSHKRAVLMKGSINTTIFMRGILNRETGIRTGNSLSLLTVYELNEYHKLLFSSDSGINVAPDFERKKDILTNSIAALHAMGLKEPKVGVLTANELVDPKIPATVDADKLVQYSKENNIQAIVEGPIAFDVAFNSQAALHKGIESKVSGDLDLIIFPNIEAGNILAKSWIHFNEARWAGIVLGAKCPVILGSRADTASNKRDAIAFGMLTAGMDLNE